MALARWRPTRNIFGIQDEINRLFEDLMSREPEVDALREGTWAPDMDIAETESEIPVPVDEGQITATFRDGILTVSLPKREEAKPKEISVTVE